MHPDPMPSFKKQQLTMCQRAWNNKLTILWRSSRLAYSSGGLKEMFGIQDTSDRASRKEEITCTVTEREQDDFSHLRSWYPS